MASQQYSFETIKKVYWQSSSHEGYLNILIYRPVAAFFAVIFAKIGWTPNQVTVLSFALGILSAFFFAQADYTLAVLGLIPFHLGKMFDCADGQLARLTNKKSALGAFLDPFFDRVTDIVVYGAVTIGYISVTHNTWALYLLAGVYASWFLSAYLDKESSEGAKNLDNLRKTTSALPPSLVRLLKWDGGFLALITTLAIVFGWTPFFLILTIVETIAPLPITLVIILKRLKTAT